MVDVEKSFEKSLEAVATAFYEWRHDKSNAELLRGLRDEVAELELWAGNLEVEVVDNES